MYPGGQLRTLAGMVLRSVAATLVVLSMTACPGPNSSDADAKVLMLPDGGTALDTSRSGMTSFAKAKSYSSWKAEPAVHSSAGPHGGKVRTYVNDVMYDSLKNGSGEFPEGSITVKELYADDGVTLDGHAVNAKHDAQWVFYEGFTSDDYQSPYYFRGTDNLCSNCHKTGRDYFLTPAASVP